METAIAGAAAPALGETGFDRCAFVAVPLSPVWRLAVSQDCRRALHTYAQTECQVRAAEVRRDNVEAQLTEAAVAAPAWSDGATAQGGPPLEVPGAACGYPPPRVFIQFVGEGDRSEVESLRDSMSAAGWRVPGIELVARGHTAGDVRYYHAEQRACAEELAAVMARSTGRPFGVVSLEGSYRNLPENQLELWLPPLD
jgi:hypothetical protein